MSLINEALKRAKQAQKESPPPVTPLPHLRPVEPAQGTERRGLGMFLPIGLAATAIVGLLMFWLLLKKDNSSNSAQAPSGALTVSARTPVSETTSTATDAAKSPIVSPTQTAIAPLNTSTGTQADKGTLISEPTPKTTSLGSSNATVASTSEGSDTNHSAPAEPTPPAPAPIKLQSIVFNPKSPSALISGRVLFVGDKFRDLHVAAISRDAVVLVGGGHTNILSLEN